VVENAESFPAWNKVTAHAVVEQSLMDEFVIPLAISTYLENGGLERTVCLCRTVFKRERMVWELLKRWKQLLETNG
jgi:hypothetical protein